MSTASRLHPSHKHEYLIWPLIRKPIPLLLWFMIQVRSLRDLVRHNLVHFDYVWFVNSTTIAQHQWGIRNKF